MAVAERDALSDAAERSEQPPAIVLNTADGDTEPLRLESLCMRCHETGTTTMLLVNIPHFRELLIASFECPHCDFRNSEVQFAGAYGERGTRHTLRVSKGQSDVVGRQVVKSASATVMVPELQFEIPPATQKGVITTVEGLLREAADSLRVLQEERVAADPAAGAAVGAVIEQLDLCAAADRDFTLIVDDPAGCSHVEPGEGAADALSVVHYDRTTEQSEALGLSTSAAPDSTARPEIEPTDPHHGQAPVGAPRLAKHFGGIHVPGSAAADSLVSRFSASPEEVVVLPGHCYACGAECETRMFTTSIPHFKDVIIMSNSCDACGYRDSEVKPGGGFSDKARTITLQVRELEDLSRDVIKSDSAEVIIKELDLEMSTGSLGGLITTVEGLLTSVQDAFKRMHSFHLGDSAAGDKKQRYTDFFTHLNRFAALEEPWTLVIKDPLANSFVGPLTEDISDDPRLSVEDCERSAEDDTEYGIDHLRLNEGQGAHALNRVAEGEEIS